MPTSGHPNIWASSGSRSLLRDGFALTAAGDNGSFADIGAEVLRGMLTGMKLNRDTESAVDHIMTGFSSLSLHPDVVQGIQALHSAGYRLITLSNGSTQLAEKLFTTAGIRDKFEKLLSVEDAPTWKPGRTSYEYAATVCGVNTAEMVLTAVHPWDIHGAARAGLSTAWINREGAQYPQYFQAPDHTVAKLPDLLDALATEG